MVVHAIIWSLGGVFFLTSIHLILDCIKYWCDTVHLGLLAAAQDSIVGATELSEYYHLILKAYYSGSVHVCLREGTNTRCKSSNSTGRLTFMGPL